MAKNVSRLVLSARSLSTATEVTSKNSGGSLFRRVLALDGSKARVAGALDEWEKQVKVVSRRDIIGCINMLRMRKKYKRAIQVLEWMEQNGKELTQGDVAIRIDLLQKTEGIASAENYFNSLSQSAKGERTYGALLSCYCKAKFSEKAITLFEKMKELNFCSSLAYNNLMFLYVNSGEPEKVPPLAKEMKEKNMALDLYTYNHLMSSYAALEDIKGVEGIVEKMKKERVKFDWSTYSNLASIYVKAGLFDKAHLILEGMEKMDNLRNKEAFHLLITVYSRMNNSSGVDRAWQSLKSVMPKPTNMSYVVMLAAFSRMGDVDGLKECFDEWESSYSTYDIRVANACIDFYLRSDMVKEAEWVLESAVGKGAEPNFRTLLMFLDFYLKKNIINLALNYLEAAASEASAKGHVWQPSEEALSGFLKYFEKEKDIDGAEKFCNALKKVNCLNSEVYESLLRSGFAADKMEPQIHQTMKDSISVSS